MENPASRNEPSLRVMFGGDVMLGRQVGNAIRRLGPQYPLGPIASLMRGADLTIVNLECAITATDRKWSGAPKAFYFGAPPEAIHSLADAGVDLVSLANNHILDFDIAGLRETLHHLGHYGIAYAGAGNDLGEALAPAAVTCKGIRFGMAAFCDHQADFAAGPATPGMAWIDFDDETEALTAMSNALSSLRAANVDWPVLSLHWGPNMVSRPSASFRRLAHAAIDMGWKILFGHSAHVFHGIEIYKGCPILYAAGDLVDDYHVDTDFRNDHQLLIELRLSREGLRQIVLHPVFIDACQARTATGSSAEYIVATMTRLCSELGTVVRHEGGTTWIELA